MSKLEKLRPNIECITLSEALKHSGPGKELPAIPTGSWIDGTFHIWIGHPEDHAAWERLSKARNSWQSRCDSLKRAGKEITPELRTAEEFLLVAEGSDWCWWYGDDHFTPHGPEFDRLFRHNVKAAYTSMGINPPDSVDIPIIRPERIAAGKNFIPSPRSYINPKIDGVITSYFEWSSASRYVPNPEFGSMHRAGHILLSGFFYGFSENELFFRIDLDPFSTEYLPTLELEILFHMKNRKLHIDLDLKGKSATSHFTGIEETREESEVSVKSPANPVLVSYRKVLEISIPFESLSCRQDDRLDFFITIQPPGILGERWPLYGTFTVELPGDDFSERMWEA
jgi:hypothetical protein